MYTLYFLSDFDGLHRVLEIGGSLPPNGRQPHIKRDDLCWATPPARLWLAESQGKVFQRKGPATRGRAGTTFRVSACLRSKVSQPHTGNHKRFMKWCSALLQSL